MRNAEPGTQELGECTKVTIIPIIYSVENGGAGKTANGRMANGQLPKRECTKVTIVGSFTPVRSAETAFALANPFRNFPSCSNPVISLSKLVRGQRSRHRKGRAGWRPALR